MARALTPGALPNLLEEPDSYLEKIFQIAFTLQRMPPRRYRDLIDELTPPLGRIGHRAVVTPNGDAIPERRTAPLLTDPDTAESRDGTGDVEGGRTAAGRAGTTLDRCGGAGQTRETVELKPVEPPPLPRPEAPVISPTRNARLSSRPATGSRSIVAGRSRRAAVSARSAAS